jgi:hypothetical protein
MVVLVVLVKTVSVGKFDPRSLKDATTTTAIIEAAAEKTNPDIIYLYFRARIDQPCAYLS